MDVSPMSTLAQRPYRRYKYRALRKAVLQACLSMASRNVSIMLDRYHNGQRRTCSRPNLRVSLRSGACGKYGDEIQANHRLDEHYNCAGALVRVLCDLDMGIFVPK